MPDDVVSTATVEPHDREAFWHHVLADTFAPVRLGGWDAHPVPTARLEGTRRGRLLFADLAATPHSHTRTARHIRDADAMFFQVAVLTRGSASLEQEGRVAELSPGDAVVYENGRPFVWRFDTPWAVSVLSVPSDAVALTDAERRGMSARPLSGRVGLSGVVARLAVDLVAHASDLPEADAERVLAHATDLMVALLASGTNPERSGAVHRTALARAKAYIHSHASDPALSPDEIAAAVNISTRYLHKLFEGEHETVALHLRGIRLRCAREQLLDPRLAGRGIAAIAHDCGFGDVSGFNRVFKAAYGVTPHELRAARPSAE